MNKAIFVYETYDNVHDSKLHYICQAESDDEYQCLLNHLNLLDYLKYIEFDSYDEASLYFDQYQFNLYKSYTELIINNIKTQGSIQLPQFPKNFRSLIVYISDDFVSIPNYYILPLNHYIMLKTYSDDMKLPTLDELQSIQSASSTIPFKAWTLNVFPILKS